MNTLWTFGDSFTFGHACRADCNSGLYKKYVKYKKSTDDIWPKQLAVLLGMSLQNFGVNGYCNNSIIDSIIDNYDMIKKDDVVVIGKSFHGRTMVPYKKNLLTILSPQELSKKNDKITQSYKEFEPEIYKTLVNFQYYFGDNIFYKEQQDKRFNFLVNRLNQDKKVKKCIVWGGKIIRKNFTTITEETNGKIKDSHFSWKGHSQFTKYLYSQFYNLNVI